MINYPVSKTPPGKRSVIVPDLALIEESLVVLGLAG